MAVGYDRLHDDRTPAPDDPLYPAPWLETGTADGCLAATAADLAAFARHLLAGPAEALTSGLLLDSGDGWRYGYGLESKEGLVRHGGSMPGFASTMLGDLGSGFAIAALMNGPDEHDATAMIRRSYGEDAGARTPVRLLVRDGAASSLRRRGTVEPGDGEAGWDSLDLRVTNVGALVQEVCAAGPDVRVASPPEVRDAVVVALTAVARAHGGEV